MEHIIYKTTNKLNGRFYIGMHSTENIEDGYLGSGRRIKAELNKYGKENFVREILECLPSREALEQREAEIVCETLLKDPLCLNLKNGGEGGGKIWSEEHRKNFISSSRTSNLKGSQKARDIAKRSKETRKERENGKGGGALFKNKKHTEEAKAKIGAKNSQMTGEKNSQFSTVWVSRDGLTIKIKNTDLEQYLKDGYVRGRKRFVNRL